MPVSELTVILCIEKMPSTFSVVVRHLDAKFTVKAIYGHL